MSTFREPDARTREAQYRAANPQHSAWVSANAGSGKTHVLASRVVRLLLEGVPPARILCLTFTKAAAANMSERVFKTLADWAVGDDATLRASLEKLGIHAAIRPDLARKLFARAVETPGGLKIQTIHAFCERVLHLFPFEANVAADFRVVEELEQAELLAAARQSALAALSAGDIASRAALATLAEDTGDVAFVGLLGEMMVRRRSVEGTSAAERDVFLREALHLERSDTEDALRRAILHGGLAKADWPDVADRIARGSKTDQVCAEKLRELSALPDEGAVDGYLALFRKSSGEPKDTLINKPLAKADPSLASLIEDEAARLPALHEKWLAARILSRTAALDHVCGAVIAEYERAKSERALLDFDDLIARTRALLGNTDVSSWVLFKLDGGIDHILVDEAQDTSEPQWDILSELAREFTAGEGRSTVSRTFFAVGDEKQSIFSFQGAAPAHFETMRREFERRTKAAQQVFAHVPLRLSFRSAPDILQAVDHVFGDEDRRRGLSSDPAPPSHEALKRGLPGLVEIWEAQGATEAAPPNSWLLPLDRAGEHEPAALLASKVARRVANLVAPQSRDAVEGAAPGSLRAVTPGDIMILVRRRDAFFEAVIRKLKDLHVPVAGADRLDVVGHIAVMDCAAVGRVALLPDDDLSLATVLKSPFIGLTDEDLIALAPQRQGSLREALRHSVDPAHASAAARIAAWQDSARRLRPFDFFAHLLGAEGGRRALLSRLGPEANDALDEFLALALAHERTEAPSLVTFLATLKAVALNVKRDLDAAGDAVRVMTVHAAKGLEAKIVFLPDTCGVPTGHFDPNIYVLGPEGRRALAWSATKPKDPRILVDARESVRRAQEDEYRRLLYVAMTRAEERLYVAGYYGARKPKPDCWHTMITAALRPVSEVVMDQYEEFGEVLRFGSAQQLERSDETAARDPATEGPAWLSQQAAPEDDAALRLHPSTAFARSREAARDRARARGSAVHALLQLMPARPAHDRRTWAFTTLRSSWPALEDMHETIVTEAVAVAEHPSLGPLFRPGALAEVPISATLPNGHAAPIKVSGRIDRLVEGTDEIIIADFKSGPAPTYLPHAHIAQLAVYVAAFRQIRRDKPLRAMLIYTATPTVIELSETTLSAALDQALAAAV